MLLKDIYIRDPYILPYNGLYYMYGKTSLEVCEFSVYISKDLIEWSEPKKVFKPPIGFWATKEFWAPEVHLYNDKFYMIASFKSDDRCRGVQILKSDMPDGDFELLKSDPITPEYWECLDGTLYQDRNGKPHMIFCHEWIQCDIGEVCEMALSDDLKNAESEPKILWTANDYKDCASAFTHRTAMVTDGPFLRRLKNGDLICIWSSFNKDGYVLLMAKSDNGEIDGNWIIINEPVINVVGGHGMIFETFDGRLMLILHSPNEATKERAVLYELEEENGMLKVKN